jgi:DHA2 family multidrug resistance protein
MTAPRDDAGRRFFVALGTVLATLLFSIDTTIVNVALPHMQGSLQATQDQVAWVVTSYIVASAVATPLAGWLATRFGLRAVLTIGVAGFTIASALCGMATDLGEVVSFRILQGLFGAALVPLSQVTLLQEYPVHKHGRVMALWSIGVMVGPFIGPTLGGWLTETLSWRWAFFVNVPVGLLSYLALLKGVSVERDARRSRPFDWVGFLLLSFTLALFQLMLDRGHTLDWLESGEIVAEAFFAALLFFMVLVHTATSRHPFVDPQLFRNSNFVASILVMFTVGMAMLSPTVLVPAFLQSLQGYSPTEAGFITASRGVGAIVAVLIAGRLVGRVSARTIVALGVLMAVGALVMLGQVSVDSPRDYIVLAGFIAGFGPPLVFVPLSVAAYATLRRDQRAEAGAILTLSRTIGASIGISLAVSMLARWTQVNQSYLSEGFTAFSHDRWALLGFEPGADAQTLMLTMEIARQAAAVAYANDFFWLACATLTVLPLVWFVRAR